MTTLLISVATLRDYENNPAHVPPGDTFVVTDIAANIEKLSADEITGAPSAVLSIKATDASVAFTVAQAQALEAAGFPAVTVPSGKTVTIVDTEANIQTLTAAQVDKLSSIGVTAVAANDLSPISVADYVSDVAAVNNGTFTFNGYVNISDTAAHIKTLTPDEISDAKTIGLGQITSTAGSVVLTVAQAVALEKAQLVGVTVTVPKGDTVTIADTAADLENLTTAQITALKSIGVTAIAATDTPAVLTAAQMSTLGGASVAVTAPASDPSQNDGTTVISNLDGVGVTFDISWDPSVASAPAGFKAAVEAGFQFYADTFGNPITLYYNVGFGERADVALGARSLGASNYYFGPTQTYSALRSQMIADAFSPALKEAVATLPAADPTGGDTLQMSVAEEQALGFTNLGAPVDAANPDGSIGFSDTQDFNYSADPNQVPVTGEYDFLGTVEHEISEVMGRFSGLNNSGTAGASTNYSSMDLFRYSSGNPSTRQLTTGSSSYFSIDNGVTDLSQWNNFKTGNSGDLGDWAGTTPYTPDSYNDNSNPDVVNPLTPTDILLMSVLGYAVNPIQFFPAASVEALTPGGIAILGSVGITNLEASDTSVVLTVAQAVAFEIASLPVNVPVGDTVTIADTAANIESLTSGQITALPSIGVSAIAATDASVTLTVAQAVAFEDASPLGVTAPTGDSVTVSDTAANIESLTAAEITALPATGVTAIAATDASVTLTLAQAVALEGASLKVTVPTGDTVTLTATVAYIEALTPAEIAALASIGVTTIAATNGSVVLTVPQALAIEGASLAVTAPSGDTVTVADTAAYIEYLTPAEMTALPAIGVSAIRATDTSVTLTAAQAVALEEASLTLTVRAGATVTIADQTGGGEIESLTPGEINALPSIGVTAITDILNEFPLLLTVAQAVALEAVGITVSENARTNLNFPYVYDTAANIANSLTAAEIAALPGIGFEAIWASDASDYPQGIPLSVAQAVALENASLFVRGQSLFSPVVDVVDYASNIEMLTAVQILKLPAISRGFYYPYLIESGPIYITSNGQPLGFTVSQVDAFLETGFGFAFAVEGGGAVTVSDTAALIESFINLHTQTQLQELAGEGFTGFAATAASLQLSVADALKLEGASLVATAPSGDTVTLYDYSFYIEGLTASEIAALPAIGVTAITASDASFVLTVAQAVALESASLVVTAGGGGTVTISDTIANILSLTSGQLAGLAAIGVTGVSVADTAADIEGLTSAEIATLKAMGLTTITATDASVQLTVAQAVALEDPVVVTAPAGDTVTIADTLAHIDALTAGQLAALPSIGVSALTVADTAADIAGLTPSQITALTSIGVTTIKATDASIQLTVAQAVALEGALLVITAPTGDTVTVGDTAADIEGLTPSEITALPATGVTAIAASDASVTLTVGQAVALEGTSLVVTALLPGDTVTVADTIANVLSLTSGELALLPSIGVTGVSVADTAGDIEGMTTSQITSLVSNGVTAITATDFSVQLSVALVQALEGTPLVVTVPTHDSVTVLDTEANIDTLTPAQIAALPAIGASGIEVASLTGLGPITIDGGITLTVDGTVSLNQTITFSGAGGVLSLADPTAMSGTVSGFASPDTIDLTGALYDPSAIPNPEPGNVLQIIENSGVYQITFDPLQDFLSENFVVGPDRGVGTDITLVQVPLTYYATVPAGETVYGVTVANGGTVDVLAGGTLSGGTVSSGGTLDVESGGTASGATIDDGGTQYVFAGGTADDTVLDGSATQYVYGTASDTIVESGDSQIVESGGLAISTKVQSGGQQIVSAGGTASDTTISGGTLDVQSGGIVSDSITFAVGTSGTLQIDGASLPTDPSLVIGGVISGFTPGDTIDLTDIGFDAAGSANLIAGNELQITEGGNTYDVNLDPTQNFSGDYFHLSSDTASGTLVTEDQNPCYCRGTLILTEKGEVPVEELAIGGDVVTLSGAARPIRWIGHRAYDGRFVAGNRVILPICIMAGALADGVPARDLWVSPAHSLYLDGVLVQAEHLVNGATIARAESVERLEYFHIELDTHDVVFAEGAPAETYVDCDNRLMFANGAGYALLHPEDDRPRWEFCASRVEAGSAELTAIRAALLERTEALGYRVTDDPDLHLIVDGEIVQPDSVGACLCRFAIPAGGRAVWLASRSAVPAETAAAGRDIRRLGVAVERLVLCDGDLSIEAWHGHPGMSDGFHEDEATHRWTDGLGRLSEALLRPFAGAFSLELHLAPSTLDYRVSTAERLDTAAA